MGVLVVALGRGRTGEHWQLVDQAYFGQFGGVLQSLELGVEELGPRLLLHQL